MKDASTELIAAEQANKRRPAELYHVWNAGGEHWYHTSGDVPVIYNTNTYSPATIARGSIRYNSQLEAQTLQVKASYLFDSTIDYISINPVQVLWVSVMKIQRDMSPLEVDVVFIGQIKTVSFKGVRATINCVGFEHFLKKTIPTWRYQLNCNHQVFDSMCALTKASYKTTTVITLNATGLTLTSADFGAEADGYFIGGEVIFGNESRTVIAHVGNDITLMYKFLELVTTDTVDAYPGCDGRAETCRDKYSNIVHFLGFPFIPEENPATRVSW